MNQSEIAVDTNNGRPTVSVVVREVIPFRRACIGRSSYCIVADGTEAAEFGRHSTSCRTYHCRCRHPTDWPHTRCQMKVFGPTCPTSFLRLLTGTHRTAIVKRSVYQGAVERMKHPNYIEDRCCAHECPHFTSFPFRYICSRLARVNGTSAVNRMPLCVQEFGRERLMTV